jgi:branched-chain amino acid transport system permease protein
MLRDILQAMIDGLLLGGIYALLAAGLALIFGVMKIINFAQGAFLMLGMYLTFVLWRAFGTDPFILAVPVGLALLVFGILVAVLLLERIPRGNMDAQLLLTLGLGIMLENAVLMRFGAQPQSVRTGYSNLYLRAGDLLIPAPRLYAALGAIVVMVGLWVFLNRTWLGKALRATADDAPAAGGVGIHVRRVDALAFGVGVALAATAGALLTTFQGMIPSVGNTYIIIMFVAVVLGGMGSIGGAIVGAFVIGLIQAFSILWVPLQLQASVVFGVFLLVMLFRPQGFFGVKARV